MKHIAALALFSALAAGAAGTAQAAQVVRVAQVDATIVVDSNGAPAYRTWQPEWDRFRFDRRHVILGTVANFQPYRLQVARRNGRIQMVDLKNGTVILPTGVTPAVNERVAIVGYYSNGTFIANRVIVRG